MTKHELRQKLLTAITELYQLQSVLEYAVRVGVPLEANHVVQLDAVAKLLCGVLVKLNVSEPDVSQEHI